MDDSRIPIPFKTDRMVRFEVPTDELASPRNPLDFTNDGATCSYKVFDAAKSEALTADEASGQSVLSVSNPGSFELGDVVEVDLDDGTAHDAGAVTDVDEDAGTIQVTTALASAASEGARVRCRLGAEVAMTEYGTPSLRTRDWGFQALLLASHPAHVLGKEVDVEITFVGAPGGGLTVLSVIHGVVSSPEEPCC